MFEKEDVDYAVVEVGLGGTLDATNVVDRQDKINVITPVGLDHTDVLGKTVDVIAAQKAGIIGRSQAVFTAGQQPEAAKIIKDTAHQQNAVLYEVENTLTVPDLPHFQQQNFGLAQSVVNFLAKRDHLALLSDEATADCALQSPPGRFEKFQIGDSTIILDGAHNPQKLTALTESLKQFNITGANWLISMVDAPDEKIADCLEIVAEQRPSRCVVTQFNTNQDIKGRRSVPLEELQQKAQQAGMAANAIVDPIAALDELLQKPATTIIVTGSLFLVSILRPEIIAHLA